MTTLFNIKGGDDSYLELDSNGDIEVFVTEPSHGMYGVFSLTAAECYELARQLIASAYTPSRTAGPDHFYNALQSLNEWAAEREAEAAKKERADAIWALCEAITPAEVFFGVTPCGDQILMTRGEFERERPKHMELVTKAFDAGARAESLEEAA